MAEETEKTSKHAVYTIQYKNKYIQIHLKKDDREAREKKKKRIVNRHRHTAKRLKSIRKSAEKTNHFIDSIALILIKMTMK